MMFKQQILVSFVLLSLLGGLSAYAASWEELPVGKIEAPSLKGQDLQTVLKALGILEGKTLDLNAIDKGIRILHESKKYLGLRVEATPTKGKGRPQLTVSVSGMVVRKIQEVRLIGLEDDVLLEAGVKNDVANGAKADPRSLVVIKEKIKRVYESRGYYFSDIQIQVVETSPDSADLEIRVVPGPVTTVAKILILGVPPDLRDSLLQRVKLQVGKPLEKAAVDSSVQSIGAYLRVNQYPTSKVDDTGVAFSDDKLSATVTFSVKLQAKFQFQFSGNYVFDTVVLRELLTEDILSQTDAPSKVALLIEEKYKSVGYHFCRVEPQVVKGSGDDQQVLIRFFIREGERTFIDRVDFDGILDPSVGNLEDLFFENAPGVLKRRLFWEAGLPEATRAFVKTLEDKGFVNASVTGPRVVFSQDKKGAGLFFGLQLGNLYRISSIKVSGNKKISSELVRQKIGLVAGSSVDRGKIAESGANLETYYKSEGYVDVKISARETVLTENRTERRSDLEVQYEIEEGHRYVVGDTTIEGLKKTEPKVVQREILLHKGDPLDPQKIRSSEENIALLGLFSRFEILPVSHPDEPYTKDLKVVVSEMKPGFGEVGMGGYYEDPRLRLKTFVGLGYKNLFGLNHTASLRTELSLPISRRDDLIPFLEYSIVLGYRAPYPLELPLAFSAQMGLDSAEVSNNGTQSKILTRARIEEKLEKKLGKKVTVNYRIHRLEHATTETREIGKATDKKTEIIGSTGPGLIVDFRNDPFNPVRGSYHTLDVEFAHPWLLSNDEISFVMTTLRNSFYVPLFEPFSFAMYAGAGQAVSLLSKPIPEARLVNDLALGGQGTIRGYSPRIYKAPLDAHNVFFYNIRSELSSVLFGDLSGAVFFDTGQVFPDGRTLERYDGVGFGFRYRTPVGPVVIDFGHALNPGIERDQIKFSFTVGTL